jgi:hypothetical protein
MDGRRTQRWANMRAKVALRALALFKRKVLVSHLALTGTLLIVGYLAVDALGVKHTLLVTIAVELAIVIVVFAIPWLLASWSLRASLARINMLLDETPAQGLSVMLRLVGLEVERVENHLMQLRATELGMPIRDAPDWTRSACFKATRGRYVGVDSNTPHRYLARYKEYLKAHEEYLGRTGRSDSARFLTVSSEELARDRQGYPRSYEEFLSWHREHGVALQHVERETAMELARKAGLHTTDMAYWEHELVLVWRTSTNGEGVRVRLAFAGEPLFVVCMHYLTALEKEARQL